MKAWQLHRLGGELRFNDVRTPEPRPGSALVEYRRIVRLNNSKPRAFKKRSTLWKAPSVSSCDPQKRTSMQTPRTPRSVNA